MPVRSSTSSVLVWPSRAAVTDALNTWAARERGRHGDLVRLGCFGSFARGDWGVGSDIDLIAIVRTSAERFDRRAVAWDLTQLPVPADLVVYTEAEWLALSAQGSRFAQTVEREALWLVLPAAAPTSR